jgi:hypothetical protein
MNMLTTTVTGVRVDDVYEEFEALRHKFAEFKRQAAEDIGRRQARVAELEGK